MRALGRLSWLAVALAGPASCSADSGDANGADNAGSGGVGFGAGGAFAATGGAFAATGGAFAATGGAFTATGGDPSAGAGPVGRGGDPAIGGAPGGGGAPLPGSGGVPSSAPDSGVIPVAVDCGAIAARWELCDSGPDFCAAVFDDGAGCAAVCAAAGLDCSEVWENVEGQCAADSARAELSCSAPSGHESDYCLCTGEGVGQSGTGGAMNTGGMPSTGGSTGTGGTPATGGAGGGSGCPDAIVGFATVSGTTSGGGGGEVVSVGDATRLISAVAGSTARIVQIAGSISVARLEVGSNKTLLGIGSSASIRGGVLLNGSQNVIVKNLSIDGASTSIEDAMTVTGGSRHVWIDHCAIFNAPDGNLDIVHGSDFVTVSWTRFYYSRGGDHRFSNLVGHSDDNAAEDQNALRITFHHNWWAEGVTERMPRVRFGQVHSFNNYFSSSGNNYCIRAAKASEVLIENNTFDGVNNPHEINNEDGSPARVVARGNAYPGGTSGAMDTAGTVFSPPYSYSPDAVGGVPATVRQCAGPR